MKGYHFIAIAGVCLALFGCTTPASTNPEGKQPQLIRAVNARYPLEAEKKGITGIVTVQFILGPNGRVVSAKAIESPDPILSKAAVDAVMQWEFVPAEKNGKKVNVLMEVPFTFALDAPK